MMTPLVGSTFLNKPVILTVVLRILLPLVLCRLGRNRTTRVAFPLFFFFLSFGFFLSSVSFLRFEGNTKTKNSLRNGSVGMHLH